MNVVFGIIGALINLLGYIPYLRDIVRSKVKPQRVTWGIWVVLNTVAAVNSTVNGGGWSLLFLWSTLVLVLITFVLSIKRGVGGIGKLDKAMIACAGLLLMYWALSRDTVLSTFIAIAIDTLGLIPTIVKTYKDPSSETCPQWVLAGVAGIFTVFAVGSFNEFVLIAYPLYIVLGNSLVVSTKAFRSDRAVTQIS